MGKDKKITLSKICQRHSTFVRSYSYALPKEDPKKYINHVTHSLSSADIGIYSLEMDKFCYIREHICRLLFYG